MEIGEKGMFIYLNFNFQNIICDRGRHTEGLKKRAEFSALFKTHTPHSQCVEKNKNNMV